MVLGIGNEFGNGFGRERRVHFHHTRPLDEACHRHKVTDEIEAEICIDRVDRSDEEHHSVLLSEMPATLFRIGSRPAQAFIVSLAAGLPPSASLARSVALRTPYSPHY